MHVVIIGNGVAGMEAARELRRGDSRCEITLISEESDHFFSRPALMWVHAGQLSHRDIEPYPRDCYEKLRFARIRARVVGVDFPRKQVQLLGAGQAIAFDRLLIACGSKPRRLSFQTAPAIGVGHFVTLQDLAWYETELWGRPSEPGPPRATAHLVEADFPSPYAQRSAASLIRGRVAQTVVVIGGGPTGIEAVELALARKCEVHLFLREEHCWPLALDARESARIMRHLVGHGVQIHRAVDVRELRIDSPTGLVQAVLADSETVPCDIVVVAAGVVPNTAFLARSDDGPALTDAGAICVDRAMRTRVDDVWAAGDCATVEQVPMIPLWQVAKNQGICAARSMLGEVVRYSGDGAVNAAKLMDMEYLALGDTRTDGVDCEQIWVEERGEVESTLRLIHRGGRLRGVSALGRRWDVTQMQQLIEEECDLRACWSRLLDASFDTEFTPPLQWGRCTVDPPHSPWRPPGTERHQERGR